MTEILSIEGILADQLYKVTGGYRGGHKYGPDCARLKVILERHKDKVLARDIMETIEDETLKSKVQSWMSRSKKKVEAANAV